ncbi:hypothetical protein [uncultured Rikenella sp.]|uniref:hypothetical protein n=1 Tax=uncultured Rikenella sp. TaxID=368003 RepID=UPI00260DBF96|nr:hypothetical protein [uncultured Rikenella sp.]
MTLFFLHPAPGFRGGTSGELVYVGNGGYNWGSSTSGTGSIYLRFYATALYLNDMTDRASSFQLRCLSE